MKNKVLVLLAALLVTFATGSFASDYFDATGIPVQRSTVSSAEFRTEFAAITSGISDKLPALTGNGDKWLRINAGGTAIGSETTATLIASLSLSIGVDVQAWDAQLDDLAALAFTDSNFIVGDGANWAVETGATVRTSLGLGSLATVSSIDNDDWDVTDLAVANGGTGSSTDTAARVALNVEYGVDVQAFNTQLLDIAGLTPTNSNFIVGNGSTWVAESGATVRTSLGLGALAELASIDDDNWDTTDLAVANGGTGSSTDTAARVALNVEYGVDVQAWTAVLDANTASFTTALNTKLGNIETLADVTDATNVAAAGAPIITTGAGAPGSTPATEGDIYIDTTGDNSWIAAGTVSSADWKQSSGAGGGDLLAANNLSDVVSDVTSRANLNVEYGVDVQAYSADLLAIAALAKTDSNFIVGNGSAWVAETGATVRTSLGLGTLATASNIDGGDWSGSDLAIADGGTASSTASDARDALNVEYGVDVQAYDADLTAMAAVSSSDSNFMVGSGAGWVAESGSTARSSMGAQASDSDLTAIAALSKTNNNFIVANGSAWALESASSARTSLGLGSLAQDSTINNTDWSGTDLAIANGGTGAGSASAALSALGAGTEDSPEFTAVNVGAASDTTLTRKSAGELEVEGRALIAHDDTAYVSGKIFITSSTPTDTSGMATGDMKFVY